MVLVAIRIGAGSRAAVAAAARLAQQLGTELRLVYVAAELEAVDALAAAAGQTEQEARMRMLDEIEELCRDELGEIYPGRGKLVVREGNLAEEVARAAVELNAQLIVCGMKGRGRSALAKLVLGDATGAILERAPCPVVVIPPAITHSGIEPASSTVARR